MSFSLDYCCMKKIENNCSKNFGNVAIKKLHYMGAFDGHWC